MADIENVTKGLEHCLSRYIDGLCDDCPYMGAIDKSYMVPMKCKEIIMRDALELLKEKQPRKVNNIRALTNVSKCGECPLCGGRVYTTANPNFCGHCGDRIDWNEGEQE